ncbi:MAG: hypothetical protein CSA95_08990 [Bacteroidetes bacterium]|nr:MAG: hypothetical protein CSA95_08990 [Bacteroidota bacterium]PIE88137.1 MAG: hypothetical protein CSA04_03505 [Bacteroidota bacterium]
MVNPLTLLPIINNSWIAFLPLALVGGGVYAFILYRKNSIEGVSPLQHALLFMLRLFAIALLILLLFNPVIRKTESSIEKPVVVLAHDNSLSVASTKDSLYYRGAWLRRWEALSTSLEKRFHVRNLLFGETVSEGVLPSYEAYHTDLSSLTRDLTRRFAGRRVAAVVLASDGIMNRGVDPVWEYHLDAPLYTIALGDTVRKKDRYIQRLFSNEITYAGNVAPLEVDFGATLSQGEAVTLSVYHGEKRLDQKRFSVDSDHFFTTASFAIPSHKPGLQRYSVRIDRGDGELNVRNNQQDFYIRVLEGKKKVALLSSSLSPDISSLMQAFHSLNSYETDYVDLTQDSEFSLKEYDMLVLYGIPDDEAFCKKIQASQLPLFVIFTHGDNIAAFNKLEAGIRINRKSEGINRAYPVVNEDFNFFNLSPELADFMGACAPLRVPFASFEMAAGTTPLLLQKIGNVKTSMPLLALSKSLDRRYAMLLGDGFWSWRMSAAKEEGTPLLFDQLLSGVMQYLSVREEKEFLYVKCKERFYENERIRIEAEVYDENYLLNNEAEVSLILTSERGDQFPFVMLRRGEGYSLDAGTLLPGAYTYVASVPHSSGRVQAHGAFVVSETVTELNLLVANHEILRHLSAENEGATYLPSEISRLEKELQEEEVAKPIYSVREIFKAWVKDIRIFLLILVLLTIEWFLRRYAGSY